MFDSLKLQDLPRKQRGILRNPSSTRPTLWVVEEDGVRAIVKDYSSNRFLYRNIVGRFLIWRESKAYRRLRGLEGTATFYRAIDGLALVIEEVSGKNMEELEKGERLPEDFFEELRALAGRIHRRGLAHCDLKRAPNILLGNNGKPYVVDWSASISQREFRFFPFNRIYQRFILDDLNAIIKLQLKHVPDSIDPDEKRRYYHRSTIEKLIRALRDRGRDLLQRIA
jgi:RIO-like serine/threonine protein kinase